MTDINHIPWSADEDNIKCFAGTIANVYDPFEPSRRTNTSKALTEYIVKAVNNHEALLSALEDIFTVALKSDTGFSNELGVAIEKGKRKVIEARGES